MSMSMSNFPPLSLRGIGVRMILKVKLNFSFQNSTRPEIRAGAIAEHSTTVRFTSVVLIIVIYDVYIN